VRVKAGELGKQQERGKETGKERGRIILKVQRQRVRGDQETAGVLGILGYGMSDQVGTGVVVIPGSPVLAAESAAVKQLEEAALRAEACFQRRRILTLRVTVCDWRVLIPGLNPSQSPQHSEVSRQQLSHRSAERVVPPLLVGVFCGWEPLAEPLAYG
jgi:hypothetical protein